MNTVSRSVQASRRRQAGFSMVEVLVAIVVLSFGLLGMVGLQAAALKGNRDARLQSVAAELARELGEMMRGNHMVGVSTDPTKNWYMTDICQSGCANATYPNGLYCLNVSGTGCTTADDLAKAQMTEWWARVNAELPGARVKVCQDTTPFDTNGLPQWTCTSSGSGDVLVIKIGWTRNSTDKSAPAASAVEKATDSASRPGVSYPVTAGT